MKSMAIPLMILGMALFIFGLFLFIKKENTIVQAQVQSSSNDLNFGTNKLEPEKPVRVETEADAKEKGNAFEKFIVQKFDQNYFQLLEWQGDKIVNGIYPKSTMHPDLLVRLKGKEEASFAVECKWRQNYFKGGIEFASADQVKRYKTFMLEKKIPVFIVVGLGGNAEAPEKVFVIPLEKVKNGQIPGSDLTEYLQRELQNGFFYDRTKLKLSLTHKQAR